MTARTSLVLVALMAKDLILQPAGEHTPDRAALLLLRAGYRARDIARSLDEALRLAADPVATLAIADGAEPEALAA